MAEEQLFKSGIEEEKQEEVKKDKIFGIQPKVDKDDYVFTHTVEPLENEAKEEEENSAVLIGDRTIKLSVDDYFVNRGYSGTENLFLAMYNFCKGKENHKGAYSANSDEDPENGFDDNVDLG